MAEYKEYDHITAEYQGFKGSVYRDNMFDLEFCNFTLYDKTGSEIFHATLHNEKQYTEEQVKELIKWALKCKNLLKEKADESKIKLYVSKEAPISQDCLYADETKLVSWFEETECELEHEECQLLLLEDRLAEERKKVVQEIGQQLGLIIDGQKQVCCDGDMTADKTIMAVLDQIERGE